MQKELDQLADFDTFKVVEEGKHVPRGYRRIVCHMGFNAKFDGNKKSRLGTKGHRDPKYQKKMSFPQLLEWKL